MSSPETLPSLCFGKADTYIDALGGQEAYAAWKQAIQKAGGRRVNSPSHQIPVIQREGDESRAVTCACEGCGFTLVTRGGEVKEFQFFGGALCEQLLVEHQELLCSLKQTDVGALTCSQLLDHVKARKRIRGIGIFLTALGMGEGIDRSFDW